MGWPIKKLVEVADLITCGVAKRPSYVESGIPFLSARNVKSGEVVWENYRYISLEAHQELTKNNKPERGDILYTRVGSYGEAAIVNTDEEFSIFVSLTLIKPKRSVINNCFLKYYLNSDTVKKLAASSINGVGVGNLNVGTVRQFPIALPSINEQKRIVAILDGVFADIEQARAKTEQNLKNARELFESYLQQVFSLRGDGWVGSELFDHVKFIDYRGKTPKKTEDGLRLITAKNVRMGFLKHEPAEFVAPESYDEWMTRGIPQKGDVLFTTEAPLANVAQLDTDEKVVFAQRIITMQPDRSVINNDFLKYLLLSSPIQKKIHEKGTGATATGIKASLLKKIPIEYPSCINEQIKHVEVFDSLKESVNQLDVIYQNKLQALDELKQSILQKAFSGELNQGASKEEVA